MSAEAAVASLDGIPASVVPAPVQPYADDFAARAEAREGEPESLQALRERAFARFAELGFPSMRQEAWRFTNVGPLARTAFERATAGRVTAADAAPWLYAGTAHLVVVDGVVAPELSDTAGLPAGVTFVSLREAIAAGHPGVELLGRHAGFEDAPFAALNTALFEDGVLLHLGRGVVCERPLQVLFLSTGVAGEPRVSYPRLLVVAEEHSNAVLVERYATVGEGETLAVPVSELVVGADAVFDHYRLAQEGPTNAQVGLQQLYCARGAHPTSYSVVTGGSLVRQDVRAVLDGEGVDAVLNGLYLTRGRQHVDHQMLVEHRAPHCGSHELYKGILEDRSRAVFNGLIHVLPGAQKTDAKQTNRNLLLSNEALVNTNPQLRIFADDVKCTHGSTVGQLDEEAVFYLRSRGIGEEAAKSLLTYAFARDVIDRIKAPAVRHDLEELLLARLPKGDVVRQAI
ncbi:MAG TPA: Fe-S cluster assembly protein SufD [Thermoanaerobaculia bacterium]|nr:Fe-S cluster assembly protein SufD [Thermoanaerobaculia bacterium]